MSLEYIIKRFIPHSFFAFFLAALLLSIQSCHSGRGQADLADESFTLVNNRNVEKIHDSLTLSSPQTRALQARLQTFYNHLGPKFNGSMLVAHNGVVVFEDYQGQEDFGLNTPITKNTTFQLASTSKPFTAMAILLLRKNGKLHLSDDIRTYFPGFPYKDVTIKTLLNHRSGLPEYLYFGEKYWKEKIPMTNDDLIDLMIAHHPNKNYNPDTRYSYTNTNYALLGSIIEKVSGLSLQEFLEQAFFEPLGMKNTFVYNPMEKDQYKNRSLSYDARTQVIQDGIFDGIVGDKNVYSTARDLLKWSMALYPGELFSKEELEEAFTPYSNEHPGIKNYGLGWHLNCYPDSTKLVFHNGWWHGNTSSFYRFVENETTLIILSNRLNKQIYNVKDIEDFLNDTYGQHSLGTFPQF